MGKHVAVVVLLFCVVSVCFCGWLEFEDRCPNCGIKVERIEMLPDPAKLGEDVVMAVHCNLQQPYTGGQIEMKVYYSFFGFWVYGKQVLNDTCAMIGTGKCPMQAGQQVIPFQMLVDDTVPTGDYSGDTWIRNAAGTTLSNVVIYWTVA